MKRFKLLLPILALGLFSASTNAQIATGGPFALEKSVVAGGGGAGSGGAFEVGSTTGQSAAGGPKTGDPFSLYSGFWTADTEPTPSGPCPFGQGYWKNHPEAWPVDSLVLGDEVYTKAQLLVILNTPIGSGKKADASLILAYQLIAAKLNVANGVDPGSVSSAITDADALLAPYNGKVPYMVAPASSDGQLMVSKGALLETFNNGQLTPGCSLPPV